MARFILFLILLIPLTVAGDWLMNHPGSISIDWMGYTVEMHTALAAVLLLLVYMLALLLAFTVWQIATWPERRRAKRRYRTLAKGLQQITHGITALALGDESGAEAALKKARAILPGEPLPQLLTAQLLQRQGRQDAARSHLRALLAHPSTAQIATHRLIEQHMARQEWTEAAALAEEARGDAPRDRWLVLTLIDLYARLGNSARVLMLTEGWHWQSPLSREERHRYAAIGYLLAAQGDVTPRARANALRHAYGYAPEFLPAALGYAEQSMADGEFKRARKILQKAWRADPSILLIAPILQSLGDATPRQQLRLLKPFGGTGAAHHLLLAQQAIDSSEYARAKTEAAAALAIEESKLGCALMAEAEKQLNGAEAATVWMARGMDAPAPASWICQRCGAAHAAWQPHCQGCGSFDSLVHERPETRITSVELAVS